MTPRPRSRRPPRHPVVRAVRTLAAIALGLVLLVLAPTLWVLAMATPQTHAVTDAPAAPTVLVLGAAVWNGEPSPFLAGRLDVAVALVKAGKAKQVIVSGDGRTDDYNEPRAMKKYLVTKGIPAEDIVTDPAGNDTFASCQRARDVYGVTRLVIATQDYHLPRAITACRMLGIEATGVGDTTARNWSETWWWGVAREVPANWKLVIDLLRQ